MSAAIYLGRAQRDTLVIDSGHSMAKWEPVVRNYLGFPEGVSGDELLELGRRQAEQHDVRFSNDEIVKIETGDSAFRLEGKKGPTTPDGYFWGPAFSICHPRSQG